MADRGANRHTRISEPREVNGLAGRCLAGTCSPTGGSPAPVSCAEFRAQPGGCAQGAAQGVLSAAGGPRCPGLGAQPPGEALLLGGCHHFALSFTADLPDDVGVCVSSPGPLANTQTGRILTTTPPGGGTLWQPRSNPRQG
jgi:hypothetical protein